MGLAASQARLLTITSRLSSNELRQQNIANAKMRLSNDSDKISQEYSDALNNKTLKMNGVPLTYDDLTAAGYSVRKASDVVSGNAGSSAAVSTSDSATKTVIQYDESLKPKMTLEEKNATRSQLDNIKPAMTLDEKKATRSQLDNIKPAMTLDEKKATRPQSDNIKPEMTLDEKKALEPQAPTVEKPTLRGSMTKVSIDDIVTSFNEQNLQLEKYNAGKYVYDELMSASANDLVSSDVTIGNIEIRHDALGMKTTGHYESYSDSEINISNITSTLNKLTIGLDNRMNSTGIGTGYSITGSLSSSISTDLQKTFSGPPFLEDYNSYIEKYTTTINQARARVNNHNREVDTYETQMADYEKVWADYNTSHEQWQTEYDNLAAAWNNYNNYNNNNTSLAQWQTEYDSLAAAWNNYNTSLTQWQTEYDSLAAAWNNYNTSLTQWQTEYDNLAAACDKYYNSGVPIEVPVDNSTSMSDSTPSKTEDLSSQLRANPDYLIQGLLSGYLALFDSEGKMVSLSANNDITTEYDTTDDAAAEATYNTAMAKINRKEKLLDTQMTNLNTEYSSLSQELESIKSIIQNHTSKDFQLFS